MLHISISITSGVFESICHKIQLKKSCTLSFLVALTIAIVCFMVCQQSSWTSYSVYKIFAARIIFFLPKFCHITPVLVRLHWLPIKSRIHFKICLTTFKVLHGLSPSYLFDLILVKKTRYSLRSFQAPVLNRPRTLGDRSFAAAAPTLWNALPQEIRQCQNINVFKRRT